MQGFHAGQPEHHADDKCARAAALARTIAVVAACVVAACSDLEVSDQTTLTSSQLLFLSLQNSAPAVAPRTVYVVNSRPVTVTLSHNDQFNTAYAEVSFPVGSLARLNGQAIGAADSVQVTLTASSTDYSINIAPAGLEFSSSAPTAKFNASVYGDFAGSIGSTRFGTAEDFFAALSVWEEISPATWQELSSTSDVLRTTVTARTDGGGTFALAAPR